MSDKDYLDWYKNDLDLEARIEQKLKALEKKLITAQEKIIDFEKGEKLLVSDIYNSKKEIAELKKGLNLRIDTQHDSDMRSLDIIGINELDIRHIKSVLKEHLEGFHLAKNPIWESADFPNKISFKDYIEDQVKKLSAKEQASGGETEMSDKREPNIVDYMQQIDGLEIDIEWLKKDIEKLEEEKEFYRIEANKDHGELIMEFIEKINIYISGLPEHFILLIKRMKADIKEYEARSK